VIAALAVWRLTQLLHGEAGPCQLLARARAGLGSGALGQMVGCFYCLSLWVALPITPWLAERWADRVITWLALSGAAIVIEQFTAACERHATAPAGVGDPPPATWHEDPVEPTATPRPTPFTSTSTFTKTETSP
jgi:hypothetical protein